MRKNVRTVLFVSMLLMLAFSFAACNKTATYTVSFDTKGGNSITGITQDEGSAVNEPTAPTKGTDIFKGWYFDDGLTQKVTFPFSLDKNYTLYARWATVVVPDSIFTDALADDNPTVTLTEDTGTEISQSAIAAIKESSAPVKVELPSGLVVTIDPATVTTSAKALDLNIKVTANAAQTTATENAVVIPEKSIYIEPSTHGEYGLALSFTVSASQLTAAGITDTEGLKLWYIADNGLVSDKGAVEFTADGAAKITITGASSYVLSKDKPYLVPEFDFADLDSVLDELKGENFTVSVPQVDSNGNVTGEQIIRLTENTFVTTFERNGVQYGSMNIYIHDNGKYYNYYSSEILSYDEWDATIITKAKFDTERANYTGTLPQLLNKDSYTYDAATKTHNMKSDLVAMVTTMMYRKAADSLTVTLESGQVVTTITYSEFPAPLKLYVWDVGLNTPPTAPKIDSDDMDDIYKDAEAVTLGTPKLLSDKGTTLKFTPSASGNYAIYPSMKHTVLYYTLYNSSGFAIANTDSRILENNLGEGGKGINSRVGFFYRIYTFEAGETYYFSVIYDRAFDGGDWDVSIIIDVGSYDSAKVGADETLMFFGTVPIAFSNFDDGKEWRFDLSAEDDILEVLADKGYVLSGEPEINDNSDAIGICIYDHLNENEEMYFQVFVRKGDGKLVVSTYTLP